MISNLTFKISPIAGVEVVWETNLLNRTLYVELSPGILPEGSRDSLVTLLEFAEERLNCKHVVLRFNKDRTDRVSLLRVFNFFGFQILPPGHALIINPSPSAIYMAYAIDGEDDDDDDDSTSESDGDANALPADEGRFRCESEISEDSICGSFG